MVRILDHFWMRGFQNIRDRDPVEGETSDFLLLTILVNGLIERLYIELIDFVEESEVGSIDEVWDLTRAECFHKIEEYLVELG